MTDRRPRGPARFRQKEIERAIRAAQKTGAGIVKIALDGSIEVIVVGTAPAAAPEAAWDEAYS